MEDANFFWGPLEIPPEGEQEAFTLRTSDGTWECTPANTSLFHFAGALAVSRSHLFRVLERDEDEGSETGVYVFDTQGKFLPQMMAYMLTHGYTVHANLRSVAECDEAAYQSFIDAYATNEEIPDEIPDDWDE